MKLFATHIKDSIDYALSDKLGMLIVSSLVTLASLVNKDAFTHPFFKLFNICLLIVVGYGSYVSWYTLKGRDEHPHFKNNLKRLIWEGFKKSVIIFIYSGFLWLVARQAKHNFINGNLIIAVCWSILFVLIYLCLISGLLNRYLHNGKFLEAFHLVEIINLIKLFDNKSFIKVIIAVIISQTFAALVVVKFNETFGLFELIYSIATFFLSPFLYIATKRLIALNVYELLENQSRMP